jgi:riboflavin kinase / FMN adenylyltransferase
MEIVRRLEDLKPGPPSVVTVGVFDGVHIGHQTIMRIVKADAEESKARSVAVTFDRMPEEVVSPGSTTPYITTLDQKLDLIAGQAMDLAVVLPLEQHILDMSAECFVQGILCDRLRTLQLVVGTNFVFGKGRSGNIELLRQMGQQCGFEVVGMSPIKLDGSLVSSTVIRRLISNGNIERANEMLGRPFALQGEVVRGEGIGATLGFPTANMRVPDRQIIPGRGVYATSVYLDGRKWIGAMNVGLRPTVGGRSTFVEVYIIGFSGNIYGRELRVEFHRRLREETRFADTDALRHQIQADIQRIVEMLG